jgi:hypothetical protein
MLIQLQLGPETQETIRSLGDMGRSVAAAVDAGLKLGVEVAAGTVKENYLSGQALRRRTGNLARSIQGVVTGPGEGMIGVPAGTAVDKYQWLLGDEQKTITPTRGQYLAIPIGENLTGAGVARYTSPRQVEGGFFIKTKTGRLLFGYQRGKKGKFRPLFTLVTSVLVQGSGALYDGVMESLDDMTAAIQQSVDKAIEA